MARQAVLKERGIRQELSNKSERLVEGHFIRDTYTDEVAVAFIPERGHVATFRLSKRQVDDLRTWLARAS